METWLESVFWKPEMAYSPYSLGKLFEWKQLYCSVPAGEKAILAAPYSLGKLFEWKQGYQALLELSSNTTPYSLGKLFEWKQLI
jgi:hypothetical protein